MPPWVGYKMTNDKTSNYKTSNEYSWKKYFLMTKCKKKIFDFFHKKIVCAKKKMQNFLGAPPGGCSCSLWRQTFAHPFPFLLLVIAGRELNSTQRKCFGISWFDIVFFDISLYMQIIYKMLKCVFPAFFDVSSFDNT